MHSRIIYWCLAFLLLKATGLYSQNQIVKAHFENTNGEACISLEEETDLSLVDVAEDEIVLYELPSGQNGFLEVFVRDIPFAHFELSLEVESSGTVYRMEVDNLEVTAGGSTVDINSFDVLRIQRCGKNIKFYHNANLLYELSNANINAALVARIKTLPITTTANVPSHFVYLSFPNVTSGCPDPPNRESFIRLKKKLDASYAIVTGDYLRFSYEEDYAIVPDVNDEVNYRIFDSNYQEITTIPPGMLSNNYGINWQELNIASIGNPGFYVLELSNVSKGETYFLRFKYSNDALSTN